jgi:two-component system chemotaxis response regulator CheY
MPVDKNMKILVVDDFKTMVRLIDGLLRQLGFTNIDEASNGQMALEKLQKEKYNLVLSDWNMEPMSGLDLLKQVRATEALKAIPFILITAESKPENIIAAKKAGVNNYIVKPFNANTLKEKLTAVLGAF